jgi:hypothetical protein
MFYQRLSSAGRLADWNGKLDVEPTSNGSADLKRLVGLTSEHDKIDMLRPERDDVWTLDEAIDRHVLPTAYAVQCG